MHVHMDDSVGFFPKPSVVVLSIQEAEQEESLCIDTQMPPG